MKEWTRIYRRLKLRPVLLVLYLILLATLGAVGRRYYGNQQKLYERRVHSELGVVADLKVAQISEWRREKLEDGALIQDFLAAIPDTGGLLGSPTASPPDAAVIRWMESMKDHRGFQNIMLVDAQAAVRFSLSPQAALHESCREIIREVMVSRRPALSDLHLENGSARGHLSVAVPLLVRNGQTVSGAIVLRIDPGVFLHPLIQSWPTPSRSAETLLVRREGDRVLFLNELRHRKNTELRFSLPIYGVPSPTPAAEAVAGRTGEWTGRDYRGIPVLAAARKIPETPWYLISKVDLEEVNTPIQEQSALISILLLLFVLATGPAVGLLWHHQRSRLKGVRHESEVARRALVEHYSYLSRHTSEIILLGDAGGRIVEANDRAARSYGYDREELLGLNIRDLVEPAALAEFDARWNAPLHPAGVLYETLHRRKDGSTFPVEVGARVIEFDGGSFRQTIVRDITERRNNEERLRRAGIYNRRLIEAALDPLVTISPDGTITDVNRATERVTGIPREQVVGTDFSDYFTDPDKARAGYVLAFRDGQIQNYELEIRHRDGHLTPVIYSASVYRDKAGEVVGVFAAARDITERKRIQAAVEQLNQELEERVRQRTFELEETNKELEAFTYSVSHDLRAPLRSVNGFSRILADKHASQLSQEALHYLDMIRQSALHMGKLVDDLLALSRLGRQSLRKQMVAPDALARQALEELSGELEGRQVEVIIGDLPPCEADPALLKQVFVNLLSNALKYSRRRQNAKIELGCPGMAEPVLPEDTGVLKTPRSREAVPHSFVCFVRDNGVGFDMRYANKLFGVFQRLHTQTDYEGSGVGLAIVERIVRRHGGKVWAEAEVDKGATFFFTLGRSGSMAPADNF